MKRIICVILAAALLLCAQAFAENAPIGSVATEDEMTDVIDMDLDGVPPVTADMLNDGVYSVGVDSSSAMFKTVGCALTVRDGSLTARLYMKSRAYSYMYPGTAQEAAATAAGSLIPLMEDENGLYFELPLTALDSAYICAALSERKQAWYPRTLVFRSDSLPLDAFKAAYLTTPASLGLADGIYECAAVLEGKGRTGVESPAAVTFTDCECIAHIVFTTAKIDYIILNGEKYLPVSVTGGAAFDIPVFVFDRKIALTVDSTAIKPAAEVQYSLVFFSDTLVPAGAERGGE